MAAKPKTKKPGRNGYPLSIPLPFDDAIRAALETPPDEAAAQTKKKAARRRPSVKQDP